MYKYWSTWVFSNVHILEFVLVFRSFWLYCSRLHRMWAWKTKVHLEACWTKGQRRAPLRPGYPARWTCVPATGLSSLKTCGELWMRFTSPVNPTRVLWNAGWVSQSVWVAEVRNANMNCFISSEEMVSSFVTSRGRLWGHSKTSPIHILFGLCFLSGGLSKAYCWENYHRTLCWPDWTDRV